MSRIDKQVNVRLEAEIIDRLKAHALDTGQSMTSALGRLLDTSLPHIQHEVVKSQIRLPGALHAKLQAAAKQGGRSFNSEMVRRLESTFL